MDEKAMALQEWKVSMDNARHFNDLLMRFRMLWLPMVVTLAVAAIASNSFVGKIRMWSGAIPVLTSVPSAVGIMAFVWHTPKGIR